VGEFSPLLSHSALSAAARDHRAALQRCERAMSNNQQYATLLLPSAGARRDSLLADAISVGPLDEYFRGLQQSVASDAMLKRLDEGQRVAAEVERKQAVARAAHAAILADSVERLARRLDSYEAELAIRRQRAADAAEREEQERIQRELDSLPDPDDPALHYPGGELHSLPPPAKATAEDQGDLPSEVHEGAPPHSGNFTEPDPVTLGNPYDPKQVPQPTAVSLW
jgi:hypothetical protein